MALTIDIHVHTSRYSPCSVIDPDGLVKQAIKAGLDGVVITEHQYQWSRLDLDGLLERAGEPHFLLLAGFEYASVQGDILIYGLIPAQAHSFVPGMAPAQAVERAHELGATCIAAHPTRAGMGFDESIVGIPFDAIEVQSVNLKEHEQRLAMQLSADAGVPAIAASDAHQIHDVGRYATEFTDPVYSVVDLQDCIRRGRFRPAADPRQTRGWA